MCCALPTASSPAHRDRWLLFAREGGKITVAKCAQRSNLAGINWGFREKAYLYFVFDHVCLFILGVQGADLSSQKGNSGLGLEERKMSVCLCFVLWSPILLGSRCSLFFWLHAEAEEFNNTHIHTHAHTHTHTHTHRACIYKHTHSDRELLSSALSRLVSESRLIAKPAVR